MWIPLRTLLLTSVCLHVTFSSTQFATANRDGYDVRLSLYRPSDKVEQEIGTARFQFDEVRVPSPTASVADLLTIWKINPDFEAVALLFDMNPEVALQGGLYGKDRIRFIRIEPTPESAKALSEGFLYKIHYDEELMSALLQSGEAIKKVAASSIPVSIDTRSCISSAADDFGQILDHLNDGDQPLNHAMLSQVRGDADIILKFMERIATPAATVPSEDMRTICLVAKDLQLKRERFPDSRGRTSGAFVAWPMVRVVVSTVDAVSRKPLRLLTIHCVPVALERSAYHGQEFAKLSSPSEQLLPEADYVFWATKGEEPAVLGRREISIRNTGGPVSVDLAIKR